ncbi:MAG TPA: UbiX family flavin prenyltransferase [Candidatus Saccharimonadales bacterium]|nr:UbiX family flavin prenyltransferase [Candidatus Saccharimonadales bacterium]
MSILVAISGASGAAYAVRFLERCPGEKDLIVSRWAREILRDETGLGLEELRPRVRRLFPENAMATPPASGSHRYRAMVVIPCSVATLARIRHGLADTLITRAAETMLKERRRLVLCVRESPLSTAALENAAWLSHEGVVVMPCAPPFYKHPRTLEEAVDHFVDKVLGVLGLEDPRPFEGLRREPAGAPPGARPEGADPGAGAEGESGE